MIYLLDTNIIIYWFKGDEIIKETVSSIGLRNICTSIINRSELYYGAFKSNNVEKNLKNIRILSEDINILPFNESCEIEYGKLKSKLSRTGNIIDDFDLMIAATALVYDLILVTNNERHFLRIKDIRNLNIENWLEDQKLNLND